ncbi:subtilase-type protease inhibitor [Streptomyces sp. NBC_00233]|uniref:subtilase-type protease inhibitor n=1 Tax=Streptomyces sp. NBC_00233 TaxID=2975686 RepID=UPI002259DF01|nr:subtilase-type protease inhibitor [Streptomyces sp. NBC_00233]MCX5231143.1 subtilase-type protease inhibitor [Streptomyces sp. NBC_00233]
MLRRFAAASASALLCLVGTAGVAEARTESLYAPSSVVLSISKGTDASSATVLRAVTLSCAPTADGTHPAPEAACAELKAGSQDGAFEGLLALPAPDRMCPQHFDPVTVTVDGVWEGARTSWQYTFGNACVMSVSLNEGAAFAF